MLNMKKNIIDMKRQSILFIAIMISVVASAQENIEHLFRSLDTRGDKTLLSKNHYEDNIDTPSTFCRYEEIMMTKKAFGQLEDEFIKTFTNEKEAYKLYRMTHNAPRTFKSDFSVPYGSQNEY